MSTPNFALINASRYFVLCAPVYYTQENIDECELDQNLLGEFDEDSTELHYQATKKNVAYQLKARGWYDIDERGYDRSYPTHLFMEKNVSIMCGANCVDIAIQAGCTAGYYEAANFDWFISVQTCGYEYEEVAAVNVIDDDWFDNKGLSKIHAEHVVKKIKAIIDELKNEAELAFSMCCDEEMYCAYKFSNGEAGYSVAGTRLWLEVENKNKKTA